MIKLTFIGDIMCQREQVEALARSELPFDVQFEKVRDLFADSDYVIGNLETPIAGKELGYTSEDTRFNTPIGFIEALKRAGVDFVSLANNHCMDRGIAGLENTIKNVRSVGLDCDGAYLTREESKGIFVKTVKGARLGIVTGTYGQNSEGSAPRLSLDDYWRLELLKEPGVPPPAASPVHGCIVPGRIKLAVRALLRPASLFPKISPPSYIVDNVGADYVESQGDAELFHSVVAKVKTARQEADILVSYPHAGGQYNPGPGKYLRRIVRTFVEAGADVVVANHAHRSLRSQRFENGVMGFYALGNFCFTPGVGWYFKNVQADFSVVLHAHIDEVAKKILKYTFSVVKNVVRSDGVSIVVPVDDLARQLESSPDELELLRVENEAVVNRFAGWARSIDIQEEYELL